MVARRQCGFDENFSSRQRLADLESEISRVQSVLHDLERQQVPLKREINTSVPILQLPPEITSEIFIIYLSPNIWNEQSCHHASPLIFGKICSAWREVAWSTPALWTSIQLNLNRATDHHAILTNEWLLRSMGQPLAIFATFDLDSEEVGFDSASVAIISVIAGYSHQWQKVHFQLPEFCYDALECVRNHLPILHLVSICIRTEFGDEGPSMMSMFRVAPQLHTVHVDSDYLNRIVLPTNQLTTLSVCCTDVDECLDMLQRSPHVTSCVFKGIMASSEGPFHVHASQLEVLEITDISEMFNDVIDVAFDHLTIPAVRRISCHAHRELPMKTYLPYQHFISLIQRSSCLLQSFNLDGLRIFSDLDLIKCLRVVPSLSELSLVDVNITNDIFRMLDPRHPSDTPPCLLPNLRTLEYSGDLCLDFSVISSLLHSRWEANEDLSSNSCLAQLQSVSIETTAEGILDDHILSLLKLLIKKGMKISLVTSDGKWL